MSAIWESANWTRQFGIRQTGNRQFGMLPIWHTITFNVILTTTNGEQDKSPPTKSPHIFFYIDVDI